MVALYQPIDGLPIPFEARMSHDRRLARQRAIQNARRKPFCRNMVLTNDW